MRIAVVGGGVSGLVAAHLLAPSHEVVVFEAASSVGGHAHTVAVDEGNEVHHIDTGFVVFNDQNYPSFEKLLGRLGVGAQRTSMSFSVSDASGEFEFATRSMNGIFAVRRHLVSPPFYRIILEALRCQREARDATFDKAEGDTAVGEWLVNHGFSSAFADQILIPLLSAIWSSDARSIESVPVGFMATFFANHGMLQVFGRPDWYTVAGGSRRYVNALVDQTSATFRVSTPVHSVTRRSDSVTIDAGGTKSDFDRVVMATHSSDTLRVLEDATPIEREILAGVDYQDNEVVLHTDTSLLPRRRRAWASWNYHILDAPSAVGAAVTYDMTRLQRLDTETRFCVTLNRTADIDPSSVIDRFSYAHPCYSSASRASQRRVTEISGENRTHFCGAYWSWGFHEDGVRSGIRVAEELGCPGL